jgi:hypothetical protein
MTASEWLVSLLVLLSSISFVQICFQSIGLHLSENDWTYATLPCTLILGYLHIFVCIQHCYSVCFVSKVLITCVSHEHVCDISSSFISINLGKREQKPMKRGIHLMISFDPLLSNLRWRPTSFDRNQQGENIL